MSAKKNKRGYKLRKSNRKRKEFLRHRKNLKKQSKCAVCKSRLNKKLKHITFSKGRFKDKRNKRITILLGSGAVHHLKYRNSTNKLINAPTTKSITDLIKSELYNDIPAGKYIFEKLENFFSGHENLNFEVFLAILEEISDYINNTATNPAWESFTPSLFSFHSTNNEKTIDIDFLRDKKNRIENNKHFFDLWNHYYKLVCEKIDEYSFNVLDEANSSLNMALRDFIMYLQSKKYIVRIYTTNYDNFIPTIFNGYQKVFNGFTDQFDLNYSSLIKVNADRIFKDRISLNYYNLHGSIYWKRIHEKLDYSFYLTNEPNCVIEPVSLRKDNPGHQHIPTNIITGYNKLQRVSIEPFNLFMHSFFSDCKESDIILTNGYSYGDSHLNYLLAQKTSSKIKKYIHIGYAESESAYKMSNEYKKIEEIAGNREFNPIYCKSSWLQNGNSKIYIKGFENFLVNKEWSKI